MEYTYTLYLLVDNEPFEFEFKSSLRVGKKTIKKNIESILLHAIELIISEIGITLKELNAKIVMLKKHDFSNMIKTTENPDIYAYMFDRYFKKNPIPERKELLIEFFLSKDYAEKKIIFDEITRIENIEFNKILKHNNFILC